MSTLSDEFVRLYNEAYDKGSTVIYTVERILSKYGDEESRLDVVFDLASPEDQDRIMKLLAPELQEGQPGFAKQFYKDCLRGNIDASTDYINGVFDFYEILKAEGLIDF